jgi:hypothetical protein
MGLKQLQCDWLNYDVRVAIQFSIYSKCFAELPGKVISPSVQIPAITIRSDFSISETP